MSVDKEAAAYVQGPQPPQPSGGPVASRVGGEIPLMVVVLDATRVRRSEQSPMLLAPADICKILDCAKCTQACESGQRVRNDDASPNAVRVDAPLPAGNSRLPLGSC